MRRTLLITNDFPPRAGGIQTFLYELARRLPADRLVVYSSTSAGAAAFDAAVPFPVVRDRGSLLLPSPAVARRAAAIARREACTAVWFGAAAPLGLLGPGLRRQGIERLVACTHGHETGWAALPGARLALRRIVAAADVVTYLGEYTRRRLAAALGSVADRLEWLPPGVDLQRFHPDVDAAVVRRRHRLDGRPVVGCVSRLVPRKGQDVLIRALPSIRRRVPDAALLLVGTGPDLGRLHRLARSRGVERDVVFAGAVADAELPAYHAAADVFAMPCRTRRAGLDVEGLGIVLLEAAATGRPVIAGRSGGAPDAVRDGRTGRLVEGARVAEVADAVAGLLADPGGAARMGGAGRAWMESEWGWPRLAGRLAALLDGPAAPPG